MDSIAALDAGREANAIVVIVKELKGARAFVFDDRVIARSLENNDGVKGGATASSIATTMAVAESLSAERKMVVGEMLRWGKGADLFDEATLAVGAGNGGLR
ncbi:hypothetical protein LR48_Vigan10g187000 [Vigna angularis]|uniref:Uncharacterized protein n=1 Tax=Phaseolus angularis TaxID=3914 RepID=A0A0L9VLZ0_PHAAN|nr:hypothetical protein LR48_Vigan10g187000 [Vigna angularis]